jgi:hypothetical protein
VGKAAFGLLAGPLWFENWINSKMAMKFKGTHIDTIFSDKPIYIYIIYIVFLT